MKTIKRIYDFIAEIWDSFDKRIVLMAILAGILTWCVLMLLFNFNDTSQQNNVNRTQIDDSAQKSDVERQTTPPEAAQDVESPKTYQQPSSTPNQPQESQNSVNTQPQPTPKQCPAGTYNIGTISEPVCKNEPTGCPYGDSIPLDSPKCAPPKGGY